MADYLGTGICELAVSHASETNACVVRWRACFAHSVDQTELFAYWRHYAFVSNRRQDLHTLDAVTIASTARSSSRSATSKTKRFWAHFDSFNNSVRKRRLNRDRMPSPQPSTLDLAFSP